MILLTPRENQIRLDAIAVRYLTAVDAGDFDTIARIWEEAAEDFAIEEMLHGLNAELAREDK